MKKTAICFICLCLTFSIALAQGKADTKPAARAVILSGLGGSEMYTRNLMDWAKRMNSVLTKKCGLAQKNIIILAEKEDLKGTPKIEKSTAENFRKAMEKTGKALGPNDQFILFIAGHGQINEEPGKLCLPGPDITTSEVGELVDALPTEKIVIINAASGGADYLKRYMKTGRVIITATGYETEGTQTYFTEFFIRGYETGEADLNKDKKIDLLEAYTYSTRWTTNFYHRQYLVKKPNLGDRRKKPEPGKTYWLVRGKETRKIWRRVYGGTNNIPGIPPAQKNQEGEVVNALPADLDNEPDTEPKFGRFDFHWHNRRMLAEHARLDDLEDSEKAFFLWKPYKFQKPPVNAQPGETGYYARKTVLGKP
jgi:hypothetical protein